MKKFLIFSICILLCSSILTSCNINNKNKNVTINVYNWGEFISSGVDGTIDVNSEFTKKTGINVNYNTFASNEELYAKLAGGGADYDVIIPSDYMIGKLINNNMLSKIDFEKLENIKFIDDEFIYPNYDETNEYSVPYTWGTIGIFYNKKYVDESEDEISWDILWNEKYSGKILMFDNSRDSFGIAQKKLGISYNTHDEQEWIRAADELMKQKPLVQAYVMDQIFDKIGNGEAFLAPYYAGDAAILTKDNPDIGFVIPKEGTNKFVDSMCIPANSKHKLEAHAYIDFMCSPDVALANVLATGYSTPESIVKSMLNPEVANNPIFYPSDYILDNSESYNYLPENINFLINKLWLDIKIGENNKTSELIFVFLGFILCYFSIIFFKKMKKNKEK